MPRPRRVIPAFLLFLAPALAAQQAEPLRLSVTTRLVQVSVIVEGKGGKPVDDLTKEDFVVLDNGKPQVITGFVRSAGERPAAAGAAVARVPGVPLTWSNRGPSSAAAVPRTVTALVFDGLNTSMKDQVFVKEQTLRFLRHLREGDSAALYLITTELRVLHDFTDDPHSLIRALEEQQPKMLAQWSRETVGGAMRGALRKDRARYSLEALRAVGQHLSRIPGRKNLVWLTSGFPMVIGEFDQKGRPIYMHNLKPEMDATAKAIGDADVALYPVSALGLIGAPERSAAQDGRTVSPGVRGTSSVLGPQITHSRQAGPLQDMMINMAEQTGGRAFTERNDLDTGIRQAVRDMSATYTLSFQPSHDEWDGSFRQLRVQVARKGLKLRHRPGYVAAPEGPADTRDADAVFVEAIDNPLDSTGLGLSVSADEPGASGSKLHIRVDGQGITLEPVQDRWKGQLLLSLVPLAVENGVAQPEVQKVSIDLSRERYDEVLKNGTVFDRDVTARDAAGGVRVFVMDVPSRRVGSVNVRPVSSR